MQIHMCTFLGLSDKNIRSYEISMANVDVKRKKHMLTKCKIYVNVSLKAIDVCILHSFTCV